MCSLNRTLQPGARQAEAAMTNSPCEYLDRASTTLPSGRGTHAGRLQMGLQTNADPESGRGGQGKRREGRGIG